MLYHVRDLIQRLPIQVHLVVLVHVDRDAHSGLLVCDLYSTIGHSIGFSHILYVYLELTGKRTLDRPQFFCHFIQKPVIIIICHLFYLLDFLQYMFSLFTPYSVSLYLPAASRILSR